MVSSQDCEHPLHSWVCVFLSNHLCWCPSCSISLSNRVRAFHNSNFQPNPCSCPCLSLSLSCPCCHCCPCFPLPSSLPCLLLPCLPLLLPNGLWFVSDMDLADFNVLDNGRLEVVADGLLVAECTNGSGHDLSSHRCAAMAQTRGSSPRRGNVGSRSQNERHMSRTHRVGGKARLVVLAAEMEGRWSSETAHVLCSLAKARTQSALGAPGQDGVPLVATVAHATLQRRFLFPCWRQGQVMLHINTPCSEG